MDDFIKSHMTIDEAAAALRKSSRQIRRYIKDDPPRLEAQLVGRQYFISRASVTRLASQPVQIEDTTTRKINKLASQIAAMSKKNEKKVDEIARKFDLYIVEISKRFEQELASMSRRINDLEEKIERLEVPEHEEPARKRTRTPPAPSSASSGAIFLESAEDLPPDAIPLYSFADSIGVNRKTLKDYVDNHNLACYRVPKPGRPNEKPHYVTMAQQQEIKRRRGIE